MQFQPGMRLLPLVFGFALLGCGDDNTTNPGRQLTGCGLIGGSASVTVSGAITTSLNSCTLFTILPDNDGGAADVFVLTFQSSSATEPPYSMVISRNSLRPATGPYTFGAEAGQFGLLFTKNTEPERSFAATSGTMTISTSNGTTLAGTLNVTATELVATGTPPTITISGSFTAKCVDTSVTNC